MLRRRSGIAPARDFDSLPRDTTRLPCASSDASTRGSELRGASWPCGSQAQRQVIELQPAEAKQTRTRGGSRVGGIRATQDCE